MPRVLETGLLGSWRWWYEVIVRGLGGWACDPARHTCSLEAGLCDACRMFGATGWRRRFRVIVSEVQKGASVSVPRRIQAIKHHQSKWYLPGPGYMGKFTLNLIPWDAEMPLEQILLTLKLIALYGALGAKTGLGYGEVDILEMPNFDISTTIEQWEKSLQKENISQRPEQERRHFKRLPALTNMFFVHLQVNSANSPDWQPVADLRYALRQALYERCPGLQSFVMGEVRGQRRWASKIRMTVAVNGQMHVWGWIPEDVKRYCNLPQHQVFGTIRDTLQQHGEIQLWRSFIPIEGGTRSPAVDIPSFLAHLLV